MKTSFFIATPIHYIKRYCAKRFSEGIKEALTCGFDVTAAMANNAPQKCIDLYMPHIVDASTAGKVTFTDLTAEHGIDESHSGCQGAIHRRVVTTMNFLRDFFLATDREWLLSVEADLVLTKEIIGKLTQYARVAEKPCVFYTNCYNGFIHDMHSYGTTDRMTLGCTLIHREIIEKFPFRYDPTMLAAFHDAILAYECNVNGYKIYYDPKIYVEHMSDDDGSRGWSQLPPSEK